MKYLFLFAGPNGSGKSTVVKEFSSLLQTRYHVDDAYYINADLYAKYHPSTKNMPNGREKDLAAWNGVNKWRDAALLAGDTIQWETVFSHPSRLDVLKNAKRLGYHIILIYVTTINPDINVERVQQRVKKNGHDVPEEKIRSRYVRSIALLPQMLDLADEAFVYDNSIDGVVPNLTFAKLDNQYMVMNRNRQSPGVYEWTHAHLVKPLEKAGKYCLVFDERISKSFLTDYYQ